MSIQDFIEVSAEVKNALAQKAPVVALESTIISHGMPYPKNVETAIALENIIRSNGALPATIAIIKGKLKVGLSTEEIEFLGQAKNVAKVSRRDIPYIVAKKMNGATTVASTMIIANMAGIKIFATGGIGGVHRNAQQTFDISADLTELASTNVAVVCAGAKSILDLGLTLEVLETYGVPIVGYKTDEFPAFYTRTSGFKLEYNCCSAEETASVIATKWSLGLNGGIVIANPVPKKHELDPALIDKAIEQALAECTVQNITGKNTTPFLLAKVKEITQGKSLETNIELVKHNAEVASQIAVALAARKN